MPLPMPTTAGSGRAIRAGGGWAGQRDCRVGQRTFDVAAGGRDYGDSLLKLNGQTLNVEDYFAPFNVDELERDDGDLGSGGPVLLPDQTGAASAPGGRGRQRRNYLPDRSRPDGALSETERQPCGADRAKSRRRIRFDGVLEPQSLCAEQRGRATRCAILPSRTGGFRSRRAAARAMPGICATPVVSANGMKDGVLWMLRSKSWNGQDTPATLSAFDAENIAHQLYSSEQNSARDRAGLALRFNIPTVVNGRVYVGAEGEVDVYGLALRRRRRASELGWHVGTAASVPTMGFSSTKPLSEASRRAVLCGNPF